MFGVPGIVPDNDPYQAVHGGIYLPPAPEKISAWALLLSVQYRGIQLEMIRTEDQSEWDHPNCGKSTFSIRPPRGVITTPRVPETKHSPGRGNGPKMDKTAIAFGYLAGSVV